MQFDESAFVADMTHRGVSLPTARHYAHTARTILSRVQPLDDPDAFEAAFADLAPSSRRQYGVVYRHLLRFLGFDVRDDVVKPSRRNVLPNAFQAWCSAQHHARTLEQPLAALNTVMQTSLARSGKRIDAEIAERIAAHRSPRWTAALHTGAQWWVDWCREVGRDPKVDPAYDFGLPPDGVCAAMVHLRRAIGVTKPDTLRTVPWSWVVVELHEDVRVDPATRQVETNRRTHIEITEPGGLTHGLRDIIPARDVAALVALRQWAHPDGDALVWPVRRGVRHAWTVDPQGRWPHPAVPLLPARPNSRAPLPSGRWRAALQLGTALQATWADRFVQQSAELLDRLQYVEVNE